eukprot:Gb_40848 [translate_table: standard]
MGGRKRSRESRGSPRIDVRTDISNFKDKVQKFTGMTMSFPIAEALAVVNSKKPFVFKPTPRRPVSQSLSASLTTPSTASTSPNFLTSVLSNLPPQPNYNSTPNIHNIHPFQQSHNNNSFPLLTFFNNELASPGAWSVQEINLYFEELLELNTTAVQSIFRQ